MPLSPAARAFVDAAGAAFPKLGTEVNTADELARFVAAREPMVVEPIPVAAVKNRMVPGPEGAPDVPVRIYRPLHAEPEPPVVLFSHGGGFAMCSLDSHDQFCRIMANETGAVVVSVDYRLAPMAPFPAATQDAYAALSWAAAHGDELGADTSRLAVAGDSAGGNLSAVLALMVRDLGGPAIALQVLMYPMLDPDRAGPSHTDNAQGYFLTADHVRWFWEQYLGDRDGTDPYCAPLRADLHDLPPAHIASPEYDPLRDDGEAYGKRLADAGIPVEMHRYTDGFHGFITMCDLPDAVRARDNVFAALREALARKGSR